MQVRVRIKEDYNGEQGFHFKVTVHSLAEEPVTERCFKTLKEADSWVAESFDPVSCVASVFTGQEREEVREQWRRAQFEELSRQAK